MRKRKPYKFKKSFYVPLHSLIFHLKLLKAFKGKKNHTHTHKHTHIKTYTKNIKTYKTLFKKKLT